MKQTYETGSQEILWWLEKCCRSYPLNESPVAAICIHERNFSCYKTLDRKQFFGRPLYIKCRVGAKYRGDMRQANGEGPQSDCGVDMIL